MSVAALAALAGLGQLLQQVDSGETERHVRRGLLLERLGKGDTFLEHHAAIEQLVRLELELAVLRGVVAHDAVRCRAIVDDVGYRCGLEDLEPLDRFVDDWPNWRDELRPMLHAPEQGKPQLAVVR